MESSNQYPRYETKETLVAQGYDFYRCIALIPNLQILIAPDNTWEVWQREDNNPNSVYRFIKKWLDKE